MRREGDQSGPQRRRQHLGRRQHRHRRHHLHASVQVMTAFIASDFIEMVMDSFKEKFVIFQFLIGAFKNGLT